MLTAKQFEAVGRLTLTFNQIEYAFEIYIAHLLGVAEWGVSEFLAEEGQFDHKAKRFKGILKALLDAYPQFDFQITTLQKWITEASKIAQERNRYVHAVAIDDFAKNETSLRTRTGQIACDPNEINRLAAEAAALVEQLHLWAGDLAVMIGEMRRGTEPAEVLTNDGDVVPTGPGIARLSVESSGSQITHFTMPFCAGQLSSWKASGFPAL